MIDNYERLNQEKLQVIANLSEDGLKHLIESTIKKYYESYLDDDKLKFDNVCNTIKHIIVMFEDDYPQLYEYFNASMLKYANIVIEKGFERDFELYTPYNVDFVSINNWNDLSSSIKRSLDLKIDGVDKLNLKTLYELCSNDDSINEDIVELVNALYFSFNSKNIENGGE